MLRDDDVRDEKLTSDNEGGGNSYSTEYRFYDNRVGRWLSIDPLASKFPWSSPYVAMGNNPVIMVDLDGLMPGDPFISEADAAHDFGKNYGYLSFALNAEISTSIYKYEEKGVTRFTYAVPNSFHIIGSNSDISQINKAGYEKTAKAHTHGPYQTGYPDIIKENPDDFSTKDKQTIINSYLITPGGYLKFLDPDSEEKVKSVGLTNDMPKDKYKEIRNEITEKYYIKKVFENPDKRKIPLIYNSEIGLTEIDDARKLLEKKD
ncbi:MAG TPA: DUF4329 domain-containing protein [Candidatus Kapabacteria bacterium]|nr:DUF4329 domain-containing protein [Candidatus Kapabacteria bacterium]